MLSPKHRGNRCSAGFISELRSLERAQGRAPWSGRAALRELRAGEQEGAAAGGSRPSASRGSRSQPGQKETRPAGLGGQAQGAGAGAALLGHVCSAALLLLMEKKALPLKHSAMTPNHTNIGIFILVLTLLEP